MSYVALAQEGEWEALLCPVVASSEMGTCQPINGPPLLNCWSVIQQHKAITIRRDAQKSAFHWSDGVPGRHLLPAAAHMHKP